MQQFLQFIILTFIYSSTCFGRSHAHHHVFVFGPAGPNTNTVRLPPRYEGKNQSLLLQLLSSWWWAWECPKHVEL